MTIQIYVCPGCEERLFAIPTNLHNANQILPCPCGTDIELWKETADVRRGEWHAEEYGVEDAFVMEGVTDDPSDVERAEYDATVDSE